MNRTLKVLSFTGMAACLVVASGLHAFERPGVWVSLALAVVFLGLFIWAFLRASEEPDLLRETGLPYFEREGLCFSILPHVERGRGQVVLAYQNRYSMPCGAAFLLRPSAESAALGLKRLRMQVHCDGGGTGMAAFQWAIPQALAGQTVELAVGATVEYPEGYGRLVRDREGLPVGSVADLEAGALLDILQSPARIQFVVPAGDLDADQAQATTTSAAQAKEVAGPLNQLPPPGIAGEAAQPGATPPRTDPPSSALADDRVRQLLEELDSDHGLQRHSEFVRQQKRNRAWGEFSLFAGLLVVAAFALAYGALGFWYGWQVPGKLLALIVGAGAGVLGVLGVGFGVKELSRRPATTLATSIPAVCERFYKPAFLNLKDGLGWLQDVSEYFPASVVESYVGVGRRDDSLPVRWRRVVEQCAAIDATVTVESITTGAKPRPGGRVADVQVTVRGTGIETVVFRNVAVLSQGSWFLVTPEPLGVGPVEPPVAGEYAERVA